MIVQKVICHSIMNLIRIVKAVLTLFTFVKVSFQARLVRELERSEKAELVKREKEVRSQQLLEVNVSCLLIRVCS